jgi:hypothetical protein
MREACSGNCSLANLRRIITRASRHLAADHCKLENEHIGEAKLRVHQHRWGTLGASAGDYGRDFYLRSDCRDAEQASLHDESNDLLIRIPDNAMTSLGLIMEGLKSLPERETLL